MFVLEQPIYVSGPMSGYDAFNRPAFAAACSRLRGFGATVVSPHEVGEEGCVTWEDFLRKDLALLAAARSVAVLPGWECSRGCQLEVHVAHALGMRVLPLARVVELLVEQMEARP